jgi:hypothetical protein
LCFGGDKGFWHLFFCGLEFYFETELFVLRSNGAPRRPAAVLNLVSKARLPKAAGGGEESID